MVGSGQSLLLECDKPVAGRYLVLYLNYTNYLTVCEIRVYSRKLKTIHNEDVTYVCCIYTRQNMHKSTADCSLVICPHFVGRNLALNRPAYQSSNRTKPNIFMTAPRLVSCNFARHFSTTVFVFKLQFRKLSHVPELSHLR